jgi:hypothetical protein
VSLKPGQEAEITVRLIAKQPLTAAIISDKPDPAFTVTGDTRGGTISPLAPGQKFELKYRVRAGAAPGTFSITGTCTPATAAGVGESITVTSNIQVAAASAASAFAELKVTMVESPLVIVSRDIPDVVAADKEFTVKVKVTAKTSPARPAHQRQRGWLYARRRHGQPRGHDHPAQSGAVLRASI